MALLALTLLFARFPLAVLRALVGRSA